MCVTIFVDNATGFRYMWMQISPSTAETLEGKEVFEREARDAGIKIKGYLVDNGIFKSKHWVADCIQKHQCLLFTRTIRMGTQRAKYGYYKSWCKQACHMTPYSDLAHLQHTYGHMLYAKHIF